jgi:hypothetical protein
LQDFLASGFGSCRLQKNTVTLLRLMQKNVPAAACVRNIALLSQLKSKTEKQNLQAQTAQSVTGASIPVQGRQSQLSGKRFLSSVCSKIIDGDLHEKNDFDFYSFDDFNFCLCKQCKD